MKNRLCDILGLQEKVKALEGTQCWSVIAGSGTGSIFSLGFGGKLRRQKPLSNPTLTDSERNFEGEHELYVECAWRLETADSVICTSTSSNHRGSSMIAGLESLVGATAETILLSRPGADLTINFDNAVSLLIFADQANEVDRCLNYSFSSHDLTLTVGPWSHVIAHVRRLHA